MDTKLKKFDSSIIVKGIALILALVLAGAGTMGVLLFFEENKTVGLYDYYPDFLSQGSNFEIEKSYVFYNKYREFLSLLTEKTIVYQNGDKQSYEAFQKKVKKEYNDEVKSAVKYMLNNIIHDENYPENLIEYAEANELRLVKIGDLNKNDYVSFSDIEDEDAEAATTMPKVPVPTTMPQQSVTSVSDENENGGEESELNYFAGVKNGIYYSDNVPEEYLKKADKAQAVVALSNVSYGDSILNGYYKVYINVKNIIPDPDEDFDCIVGDDHEFSSFDEFSIYAKKSKERLSKYKNMSYAIIDNESGKVIETTLNGTDKLNTATEVKNAFLDCEWSYVYNISREDWQYGSLFSELLRNDEMNYRFHTDYMDPRIFDLATDGDYTLCVSFDTSLSENDVFSEIVNTYNSLYKKAKSCLLLALLCLLGIVICIVVLVIKSGRRHGDNRPHMAYFDKMIFVLRTAIDGGIIALLFVGAATVYDNTNGALMRMLMCLCSAGITLFLIDWILYIARNIKNRSLHKTFAVVLLIQKAKQLFKKANAAMKSRTAQYRDIFNDVARKIVLGVLVPNFAAAVILWLLVVVDIPILAFLLAALILLYDIFVVIYMIRYAYNLRKIFYTLNQLSQGNTDVHIDTNGMPINVAAYANDVNAINNGLQIAVSNAVKEEKTKTELITNISHDLKTPLTSIINYVDLLSRCEITDENALGYIEILNEKSAKLKRLIEDLVEASKAQTGNINVNIIKMSLNELVLQLAGEYEDEFAAKNLTLIINGTENIIEVMADSKLAYRVLDNLLNNVKKYAMPNTRVYLTIERSGEKGIITLRNISENQLNIPAKELMARFVRGDSSRSTDGNGLGLSIAENLCLIQGGKLTLEIEGDLFTAKVEYKGA